MDVVRHPFETGLDRTGANYVPLSPVSFLTGAARAYGNKIAVIDGERRYTYGQLLDRCTRLASALSSLGVDRLDTVAIIASNVPEMIEAHYAAPMLGAVLNPLNTRLDAATIAFSLNHGQAKVLIADSDYMPLVTEALKEIDHPITLIAIGDVRPPDFLDYEALLRDGRSELRVGRSGRRMAIPLLALYLRHDRRPQRRGLSSSRRLPAGARQRRYVRPQLRLRLSLDLADVPLLWLVLPLGCRCRRRHPGLPAQSRTRGDLRSDRAPQSNASMRRTDRHEHAGTGTREVSAFRSATRCAARPAGPRHRPRYFVRWRSLVSR